MADRIRLTLDGREIEVDRGTTVLQAAGQAGLEVPRYCYHPGLTISGNCRICLVEIEKMPKLATSCTTVAADGMVVRTTGPKVQDGRRAVMEFLLANHPLDCPICDQAGECMLQEYSFRHGAGASRMEEERIKGFKQKPVGPHVMLDTERCIVCTRCVRFCQEVTHTGELGVFTRGVTSYIDTFPDREMANAYSGNTVDICPVGALTLSEFRFRKRVWELKDVPSVCGSCARGCNVNLGTADERIWRLTPRENQAVNRWWMCDEGRLSYEPLYATPRLTSVRARSDGRAAAAISWPEALDLLAGRLRQARPSGVAVLAWAGLTVEDLHLLNRLCVEGLNGAALIVPEALRGQDDELLIRADKSANAAGARLLGLAVDSGNRRRAEVMREVAAGRLDVVLVVGPEALGQDAAQLTAAGRSSFVALLTPFADPLAAGVDLALPGAAYGEFEGTWVNFQGRAQSVRRGVTPGCVALQGWQLASELLARLGVENAYASTADVLAEVAGRVAAFKGITPRAIGMQGVQVDG